MKLIVLLVLFGIVGLAAAKTDYCSKSLCGDEKHIGCNNSGDFAKSCPADRRSVIISPSLKTAILKKHNELRSKLGEGGLPNYKPCTKMATMQWDDELASLADLNVKTCKFEHDACRNTPQFPESGQNLGIKWSSMKFSGSIQPAVLSLIDRWWNEYKDASMKEITNYPEKPKKVIGHFTEMAIEGNDRIGCALSTYKDPSFKNWYTVLMACNYAKINIYNKKIYTAGKTASQCETGTNPKYQGLCSENEKY